MKGKTKNFFENLFIVIISITIIFSLYINFSKDTLLDIKLTILSWLEIPKQDFNLTNTYGLNNTSNILNIDTNIVTIEKNTTKIIAIPKEKNITKIIVVPKEKNITKTTKQITPIKNNIKLKKKITENKQKQLINKFLRETKNKINQILDTPKDNIEGYAKIRLTILKDGYFESLIYISGDKEYFDFIKTQIQGIFPLNIDKRISSQFPRYFRMKINF